MLSTLRVKQTECSETVEEGLFNSDLRDRECKVRFYPEEETGGEGRGRNMFQINDLATKGTVWSEGL